MLKSHYKFAGYSLSKKIIRKQLRSFKTKNLFQFTPRVTNLQMESEVEIKSKKQKTENSEQNTATFAELKLWSTDHLKDLTRVKCPKCNGFRKYFCYGCFEIMGDKSKVPQLKLNLQVDIIHHPKEMPSKSTGIHAKILAPDYVQIYEFPEFPDYRTMKDEIVLLFPSEDAKFVDEMQEVSHIKRLVVVDSTWQQTKQIFRDEKLRGLPCVKLREHKTRFWRYQSKGDDHLATIEAIYYFLQEHHQKLFGSYEGQMDNMLYYYTYIYDLIQKHYADNPREFPRIKDYIKKPKGESTFQDKSE